MNRFLLLSIGVSSILLLSGCVAQTGAPTAAAITALANVPTNTLEPTATPQPTNTAIPTPTTTLSFPIRRSTPIPKLELPVIGLPKVSELQEIARYGVPRILGCQVLSPGSDSFILADLDGITLVNKLSNEETRVVNAPLSTKSRIITMYTANPGAGASADGQFFVIFTENHQVQIWNERNERLYSLDIPEEQISQYGTYSYQKPVSVSISTNGKYLAVTDPLCDTHNSINQCKIRVIDWKANEVVTDLPGYYADFSPGGKFLVVYYDNKINVYDVQNWELVFYELHPSMGYGVAHVFSPKDTYFAIYRRSRVSVYRTDRFVNNLTITDYKTYYPPEVFFSTDESMVLIKSSFMASPPELYSYNIENGAFVSKETYEKMQQTFFEKIDQLKGCSTNQTGQVSNSLEMAYFSETFIADAGVSISQGEGGSQIKYRESPEITGNIEDLWQEKIIISQENHDDPYAWWDKVTGLLDITNGEYFNLEDFEITKDGKHYVQISKGSDWLVFKIEEWTVQGLDARILVYDAEKKSVISERERINTANVLFFPLEKWNAVGFIGEENCTKYYSITDNQTMPQEVCLPINNENIPWDGDAESVTSVLTFDQGKMVLFGTSKGNLIFLDTDSGEIGKVNLTETSIDDISMSEDGTMISTFSYDDTFTRVWGVLGAQQ